MNAAASAFEILLDLPSSRSFSLGRTISTPSRSESFTKSNVAGWSGSRLTASRQLSGHLHIYGKEHEWSGDSAARAAAQASLRPSQVLPSFRPRRLRCTSCTVW